MRTLASHKEALKGTKTAWLSLSPTPTPAPGPEPGPRRPEPAFEKPESAAERSEPAPVEYGAWSGVGNGQTDV